MLILSMNYLYDLQGWDADYVTTINSETIEALANALLSNPQDHIQWLVNSSNTNKLSRILFLLVILKALMICKEGKCALCIATTYLILCGELVIYILYALFRIFTSICS